MPVKKEVIILCALMVMVTAVFVGCINQKSKDIKKILDNYSNDLIYNFYKPFYFMPLSVHQNYYRAYLTFDPSAEYDDAVPETFSPDYIRQNLRAVYCIFLKSEKIPAIIQFTNRKIFDKYFTKLEKNPRVSKETLEELLQFEYAVEFIDEGIELVSDNFVYIHEDSLINGEPRYWLSEEYYEYFLSDDFTRDMAVLTAWITEKKWRDLNSTIARKDGRISIYTFDPANNVPMIHDITQVALTDPETNTYITQTGFYVFENPGIKTESEFFNNGDGSLDIMYKTPDPNRPEREIITGTRIFLSGAVTEIDRSRRVIYSGE